ncbi:CheY-like protein [Venustampulla echinocandica]|uniref:histidine kinase n=1 Tax=Venustampulla echinocandica TaxID=2656787 RepID=A0A370TUJ9_9HELO|nr:CheY-like protein [Venustampulla echinocandica]RDL39196.1 CheY-like protein [Venustampulla echinocandica]
MRIGIREQLAAIVLLTALVPLAVLAISVWVNSYSFIIGVTNSQLSLTASLKAAQIASDLLLIQSTCTTMTTRIIMQSALREFYKGNISALNTSRVSDDIGSALAGGGLSALLQVKIFSRNATGNAYGIVNATASTPGIDIPDAADNGSAVAIGDKDFGYPSGLYPNITYKETSDPDPMDPSKNFTIVNAFPDFPLNQSDSAVLVLGPMQINDSYALLSMTLPIIDNTNRSIVLGFMTVVAAASTLVNVTDSHEGLASTGMTLLIGPSRRENQFKYLQRPATKDDAANMSDINAAVVKYIFPPVNANGTNRHRSYNANLRNNGASNFTLGAYPAAATAFGRYHPFVNSAGSMLSTRNEDGVSVSVGYARPQSSLVDWLLIVEQAHHEAWDPVSKLRKIVLACVFGTVGLIIIVVIPTAHYSARPLRRLRDATKNSITPPGYSSSGSINSSRPDDDGSDREPDLEGRRSPSQRSRRGFFIRLKNMTRGGKKPSKLERSEENRRRVFKIPAKVQDRKHFITDELTELTTTFNSMTDELMLQYESLEAKVAERTRELEISKKAAEAANESKTLFIANISHELKTPLNGILGMCAVCMGEDDLPRIKRSLQVVYKSGDLLLHLLNDLLTFSKNQIGQQLSLEEREFGLADIKVQILTIFMKQVEEKNIDFSVKFISSDTEPDSNGVPEKALPAIGPSGTGRLKDMCLWGDQHRILQVIINLVSNSLKFTPEGGKVEVRIKCLGEVEAPVECRNSLGSKRSSQRTSRRHNGSASGSRSGGSNASQSSRKLSGSVSKPSGTALQINPLDPKATPRVQVRERSPTPPPASARTFTFLFEVEDTGPGIPEHIQDRVFEPFVQGDLGLSRKYGGTGLGLSICSQLAQLMGGTITLASSQNPPIGTTFKMEIPLKHTKSRAPSTSSSDIHGSRPTSEYSGSQTDGGPPTSAGAAPGDSKPTTDFQKDTQPRLVGLSQPFFATNTNSNPNAKDATEQLAVLNKVATGKDAAQKLRILVAEDNPVNQEIVVRMLKLEHIYDVEVVVAKDGKEAYDMVRDSMDKGEYFDLIFMDIQMPNLDGLQSTRLIRQMGYSAPIVALTAFAEESNVKECYDSGMDHFLSKPIRRPALKQVLKRFATIPEEETETLSITGNRTPEPSEPLASTKPETPQVNGASPS